MSGGTAVPLSEGTTDVPRLLGSPTRLPTARRFRTPALFTPNPTGGTTNPRTHERRIQKANKYVHPEVPTGVLLRP